MTKDYSGMTVNERLFVSGLMDEFDAAIYAKDFAKARQILTQVELSTGQAAETVKAIEKNPKKYGYFLSST